MFFNPHQTKPKNKTTHFSSFTLHILCFSCFLKQNPISFHSPKIPITLHPEIPISPNQFPSYKLNPFSNQSLSSKHRTFPTKFLCFHPTFFIMNTFSPISFFLLFLFLFLCKSISAQPPGPAGPTNITAILEKGGQFSTFIKLLKSTQQSDQINNQLNNSNQGQGLTVFAPPDNSFSNLKPGTLNSLSDQQKVQLVQFHVLPTFISMSQFQTVSNPLRTQAGNSNAGQFPLNVTTSGSQVNLTTGVDDAVVSNTIYTDGQLAVYQVDKVLLPLDLFGTVSAPAPAPTKPVKAVSGSDAPAGASKDSSSDDSGGAVGLNYRFAAAFGAVVGVVVAFGLQQ